MQLLRSLSDEPQTNCALEASLLAGKQEILLFYINRPSVIIGRNQCMEAEADMDYCRRNDIAVVRRTSGGGAVYHDYGNINYAFICNRSAKFVLDTDFTAPVAAALRSFGVEAVVGARKELLSNGRKISGTASYVTRGRILFHGTLLYRTDLEQLARALNGNPALRGRCLSSRPSPVANIAEITGNRENTEEFLERLMTFFITCYGYQRISTAVQDTSRMASSEQVG
jgi:lipoate-protein ligase A